MSEELDFDKTLIYSHVYKMIKNHIINKKVLDLGCGNGDFLLKYCTLEETSEIHGYVDSRELWKMTDTTEGKKIYLRTVNFEDLKFEIEEDLCIDRDFDVITSIGVIDYMEDPSLLFYIANKLLKPGGYFVLEYTNFLNMRGIIWEVLKLFLNVEIPKTGKYTIMPDKIFEYMKKYDFECEVIQTFDHSRGMYKRMVDDFIESLKISLEGKVENLDSKIIEFFNFLNIVANEKVFPVSPANGAKIIYKLRKK